MKRTPITPELSNLPPALLPLLEGAAVYDSSCSREAQVWYVEKGAGFYVKNAPAGTLAREAELTKVFHQLRMGAEVIDYIPSRRDWLVTRRVPGEDCTHERCLTQPQRLCDTLAQIVRSLHDAPCPSLPLPSKNGEYLSTARKNFAEGRFDRSLFPDNWGYATAEEAMAMIEGSGGALKKECLIHGDCCLPNVMLSDWRFSGFVDVGGGGIGDRHIDLFWALWSLSFNLKTNAYASRFLDAYGRDKADPHKLRLIAAFEVFG